MRQRVVAGERPETLDNHRNLAFLPLLALLVILLGPVSLGGQIPGASDYAQSRRYCAQGLADKGLSRVRAMGVRMGAAEMCVKALSWTSKNGDLLDIYVRGAGRSAARVLVNRITDNAKSSTGPFRSGVSPAEMWNKGDLTPSLALDAGFTRSYLEKSQASASSMDPGELQQKTEGCLNETQSLAVCAEVGEIQGTLAYQMNNAFSNNNDQPPAQSKSQGPDRAQAVAAVDQKFRQWAQSWSWDRYRPGSVEISAITCSGQCKASGQFTFDRMGSPHVIAFVAFFSGSGGNYSLARLCYNDDTTNQLDCTN